MVNSAKGRPHLIIGQYVFKLSCKGSGEDGPVCPADVEVRKQGVNAPLVVAVDNGVRFGRPGTYVNGDAPCAPHSHAQ